MKFNLDSVLQLLVCSVLAVFGVLARTIRYTDTKKMEIAKMLSNMVVAVFGSTIVFFAVDVTGLPLQLGYILSGLVGWGGPQIIDKIFEKAMGQVGIDGKIQENEDYNKKDSK